MTMQSLAVTPERLFPSSRRATLRRPLRVARRMAALEGKRYLPMAASPLAQDILERGYDGRTLEQIYANMPSQAGLLGRMADRALLRIPLHSALRERHEAMVGEICAAAVMGVRSGLPAFHVLMAPVGLGAEIAGVYRVLRERRPEVAARMRWIGLDPDPKGDILGAARVRLESLRARVRLLQETPAAWAELGRLTAAEGLFQMACCPGLGARGAQALGRNLRRLAPLLTSGGQVLFDRWEPAGDTQFRDALRLRIQPMTASECDALLRLSGFAPVRQHPTADAGCVVVLARKL